MSAQSQRLLNRWRNALVVSERELKALKSCARTSVVKPAVRATSIESLPSTSPPGRKRSMVSRVTTAITRPTSTIRRHIARVDHAVGLPARRAAP